MLCDLCQDMFRGEVVPEKFYERVWTFELFRMAALRDCYICRVLLERVPETRRSAEPDTNATITRRHYFGRSKFLKVYVELCLGRSYEDGRISEWFTLQPMNKLPFTISNALVSDNTASEISMKIASQWLRQCIDKHKACNRVARASMKPPTRLLDVGSSSLDSVLLITSQGESVDSQSSFADYRYATLSHCWGHKKPAMTLTKDTAAELAAGIKASTMPPSFRDAVSVCRSLGIRYLWIDSLCIYQDTTEDWQRECSSMGDIYQGSVCTIAATAASNSREGCFRARPAYPKRYCRVHATWEGLPPGEHLLEILCYWDHMLRDSPLLRRAWVFQERVLSPRILHFGRSELLWECLQSRACEKYPSLSDWVEILEFLSAFSKNRFTCLLDANLSSKLPATAQQANSEPALNTEQALKLWSNAIQNYSKGALTESRDKLVAIAGLAGLMTNLIDSEYLAGLWRVGLPYALLWFIADGVQSNGKSSARPSYYRAPSWSWASVDGLVWWAWVPDEPRVTEAEVLEARVQLLTEDPFGQVSGGFIRLRGPLRTVSLGSLENNRPTIMFASESFALDDVCAEFVQFDCEPCASTTSLHFLFIAFDESISFRGLILQPTGRRPGQFRRMGLARIHPSTVRSQADKTSWFEKLGNHEWLEYEEFDSEKGYTITII